MKLAAHEANHIAAVQGQGNLAASSHASEFALERLHAWRALLASGTAGSSWLLPGIDSAARLGHSAE